MIAIRIFLRQFRNGFFYLLIVAAIVSFFLNQKLDTITIVAILLINALLGFIQEWRSQRLLEKLRKFLTMKVKVRRGGTIVIIPQQKLRIGDLVILEGGDRIPADGIIRQTDQFSVDESVLSGESLPVDHRVGETVFLGTMAASGQAEVEVGALGAQTEFGKLRQQVTQISSPSQFEKDIAQFSQAMMGIVLVTLILLIVAHVFIGQAHLQLPTLLLFVLALAIGIVPEAMPLVTTLAMTSGALRLARQKVVVKKLAALEDLGNIVVLCSDKTGTVTEGSMTVSGVEAVDPRQCFRMLLGSFGQVGLLNQGKPDPFNQAIWKQLDEETKKLAGRIKVLWEKPFDPQRRTMQTAVTIGEETWLVVKGSPDALFDLAAPPASDKKFLIQQGKLGRRVLGVACKSIGSPTDTRDEDLRGLAIAGLVSFSDPLKKSADEALETAKNLGIDVRLITGDSQEVAHAVGRQLHLVQTASDILTGPRLAAMADRERTPAILKTKVFARILPTQKREIVQVLETIGPVGFIGDGINDAPALKAATVGIAADHASDIAREAADIILLKKDLRIVIEGISRGREIFANIEKYLVFTLIGDFGTFYSIAAISLITPFLPMLPVQILLSNLLSDVPMVTIAADAVDAERVRVPAKNQLKRVLGFSLAMGLVSSLFDFAFFGLFRGQSVGLLQTQWFVFSVLSELVLIFSIRSKKWIWEAPAPERALIIGAVGAGVLTVLATVTRVGEVFHFVHPPAWSWGVVGGLMAVYLATTEISKKLLDPLAPRLDARPAAPTR